MSGGFFWEKKRFEVRSKGVQRGFLSERKGKVIPCSGGEDRNCVNRVMMLTVTLTMPVEEDVSALSKMSFVGQLSLRMNKHTHTHTNTHTGTCAHDTYTIC